MKAICTDLAYAKSCCPKGVYQSVWDRLCERLFGALPPGMDSDSILPNVEIWKNGVIKQNDTSPYTFTVVSDGEVAPKASDIILYKGQYYIIGAVDQD